MIRFFAICQNTFIRSIRQGVFSVLLVVTFAILALSVPLTNWTMSSDYHESNQKMLEAVSITLLVTGLMAAAFSASGALSREIEDKTALTVISKPVGRTTFLLGKFAGVVAAVALFYYLGSLAYLMCVRHGVMPAASDRVDWPVVVLGCSSIALAVLIALAGNYLFSWTFTSTAVLAATISMSVAMVIIAFVGKGWQIVEFGQKLRPQLIVGLVLLFMAVVVFAAVAIAASTRLGQVMTLLICTAVFFVGSIHPYVFDHWKDIVLSHALRWACPDLSLFYTIDANQMGKNIPMQIVGLTGAYCACFCAGVLAIGAAMFHRRPLEGQTTSNSAPQLVNLLAWAGRIAAVAMGLIGLEIALSLAAAKWWPTFNPVFMTGAKTAFFSAQSSDALVLVPAGCLLASAVLAWLLWGFFGRGARWSYLIVTALIIASAIQMGLAAFGIGSTPFIERMDGGPLLTVRALLVTALLVVLFLPGTRRHFQSS